MGKSINTKRRSRSMVFTINNPSNAQIAMHKLIPWRSDVTHYVAQVERGLALGTRHLQGFVRWKHARSYSAAMKSLGTGHFEAAKGTLMQNMHYCTKVETREDGPWSAGFPRPRALPTVLRPWQENASKIAAELPDDRTIYWFWDQLGGTGKTQLQLLWHRDFNAILVDGNSRDAKCAIKLAWGPENGGVPEHPIVMMNLPRNTQRPQLWPILESLKDGIFFSGKYEPGMMVLPLLHVFVFANEPPLRCSLSTDKICVYRVNEITHVARKAGWTLPVGSGNLFGPGF